jgi:PemK-like, MazF-like toxin of type II toxin-antitoxin system
VSPSRPLQLGSVVWAELEDANGYRKVRPVVVASPTEDIQAGRPIHVVAITVRLPDPLPEDHVLLPWDRQGRARSGLRRRCAAVASWHAEIAVGDVQEVVGIMPPAVMGELLGKVAIALSRLPEGPAPAPSSPPAGPVDDPPAAARPDAEDGP